jgi:hypothetical protein
MDDSQIRHIRVTKYDLDGIEHLMNHLVEKEENVVLIY